MARRTGQTDELQALRLRLEETRRGLGFAALDMRRRLDVPARLRISMRRHPRGWFAGSLAAGLLAALSLGRRKKAAKNGGGRGAFAGIAGFAVTVARPIVRRWLVQQFTTRP